MFLKILFSRCSKLKEAKLQGDEGKLPILHLPFDEGAQKTPSRVRRTYVTLDRCNQVWKNSRMSGL